MLAEAAWVFLAITNAFGDSFIVDVLYAEMLQHAERDVSVFERGAKIVERIRAQFFSPIVCPTRI